MRKGRSIANLLELQPDEKIAAMIRIRARVRATRTRPGITAQHIVLRHAQRHREENDPRRLRNVRKGGIIAIEIEEGDELIDVKLTNGTDEIVLITHEGMSIRFAEDEFRDQGRDTVGVWGIRPRGGRLRRRHGDSSIPAPRSWWPAKTASASAPLSTNTASNRAAAKASSR